MTAAIPYRSHGPLSKRLVAFDMLLGCGELAIRELKPLPPITSIVVCNHGSITAEGLGLQESPQRDR